MESSDRLAQLLNEAEEHHVSSTMLDEEVAACVSRQYQKGEETSRQLEEDIAWQSEKINDLGLDGQLAYLLEHHDYRFVHDILVDLTAKSQ
jgi:hypothetical protein